jgi:hypothetical protein
VLDILVLEPGAIYVMDCGYLDFGRLCATYHAQIFFVTRAKSNTQFRHVYLALADLSTGIICDQTIALTGTISRKDFRCICLASDQGYRDRQEAGISHQQFHGDGSYHIRTLQGALAGGVVLQMDQAAFTH